MLDPVWVVTLPKVLHWGTLCLWVKGTHSSLKKIYYTCRPPDTSCPQQKTSLYLLLIKEGQVGTSWVSQAPCQELVTVRNKAHQGQSQALELGMVSASLQSAHCCQGS